MQRSRITTTTVSVIALVVALLAVTSCDWSQFRAGINRTGFEQMRSKGVPQSVRTNVMQRGADVYVFLHHPTNRARGNTRALVV